MHRLGYRTKNINRSTRKIEHIMLNKFAASLLAAAAFMLPVVGYSADSDSDRSSAEAFVKDSVITTKIKAELAEKKLSSLVRIEVDTDKNGRVVLSGTAATQNAVNVAVSIARDVKGVTSVENHIKIAAAK